MVIAAATAAYGSTSRNSGRSPETVMRPGGLEIVLDGYPGSGSVLVAVAVKAGSVYETPDTRGVTHFLEHLLFDGSERFTREEISGWVDDNGAFLNAFTRKEATVYFLLARSDLLEESIEILSQMLLHPVFAPAEIEKERKVVLEEMSQGLDNPREAVSRAADRYLYRGSSLSEPVIGYPSTIESVSRDRIIEYHSSRYTPGRMKISVTGDFERSSTLGWIDDYFTAAGSTAGGNVKSSGKGRVVKEPVLEPRWSGEITLRVVEGPRRGINSSPRRCCSAVCSSRRRLR
jgi:predicted Zn-dependent peptidase